MLLSWCKRFIYFFSIFVESLHLKKYSLILSWILLCTKKYKTKGTYCPEFHIPFYSRKILLPRNCIILFFSFFLINTTICLHQSKTLITNILRWKHWWLFSSLTVRREIEQGQHSQSLGMLLKLKIKELYKINCVQSEFSLVPLIPIKRADACPKIENATFDRKIEQVTPVDRTWTPPPMWSRQFVLRFFSRKFMASDRVQPVVPHACWPFFAGFAKKIRHGLVTW